MTTATAALSELARVARALHALGGAATISELTAATALPRRVVVRRLAGNGPSRPPNAACPRVFTTVVVRRDGSKVESVWGLTDYGAELAREERP